MIEIGRPRLENPINDQPLDAQSLVEIGTAAGKWSITSQFENQKVLAIMSKCASIVVVHHLLADLVSWRCERNFDRFGSVRGVQKIYFLASKQSEAGFIATISKCMGSKITHLHL